MPGALVVEEEEGRQARRQRGSGGSADSAHGRPRSMDARGMWDPAGGGAEEEGVVGCHRVSVT